MFFVFFLVRSLFTAINTKYKCLTESSLAFFVRLFLCCCCFFLYPPDKNPAPTCGCSCLYLQIKQQ